MLPVFQLCFFFVFGHFLHRQRFCTKILGESFSKILPLFLRKKTPIYNSHFIPHKKIHFFVNVTCFQFGHFFFVIEHFYFSHRPILYIILPPPHPYTTYVLAPLHIFRNFSHFHLKNPQTCFSIISVKCRSIVTFFHLFFKRRFITECSVSTVR